MAWIAWLQAAINRLEERSMKKKQIAYHTRLIPIEHLNLQTKTAQAVINNGLCDTAKPEVCSVLKDYGIDVVELRLVWAELEKEKGVFDFSRLEREMDQIRKAGMKIGLFPWMQHPPKWVQEDPSYTKLKCLEHNEETTLISLWDDRLLDEYDRLYGAIAEHFPNEIDFLYTSVYGDYGEVFFLAGIDHYFFSPKHNHCGKWCGDEKARASYEQYLRQKYTTVENLQDAWETTSYTFETAMSFSSNDNFAKRHDFQLWYTNSLHEFTDRVCAIVRKHFPNTKSALPIGNPYEPLEIGQIKSRAAKTAAKYQLTARWTGWAYFGDFEWTNICARRLATAAKFYGADFGVEAALFLDGKTAPAALFEALSNSAQMMHNDPGNIIRGLETYKQLKDVEAPDLYQCSTAVFYPLEGEQCGIVEMPSYYETIAKLRRSFDYEIVDSLLIDDGILENINTLVFVENTPLLKETYQKILTYVTTGQLKLYCTGPCMPYLVDTKEQTPVDCAVLGKEITENSRKLYTTRFANGRITFDAESGQISFDK